MFRTNQRPAEKSFRTERSLKSRYLYTDEGVCVYTTVRPPEIVELERQPTAELSRITFAVSRATDFVRSAPPSTRT